MTNEPSCTDQSTTAASMTLARAIRSLNELNNSGEMTTAVQHLIGSWVNLEVDAAENRNPTISDGALYGCRYRLENTAFEMFGYIARY